MSSAPPRPPIAPIVEKNGNMTPAWLMWINGIYQFLLALFTSAPTISSGIVAPTSTPVKIGDVYIDTTHKKAYFATGISSSSDWTILN